MQAKRAYRDLGIWIVCFGFGFAVQVQAQTPAESKMYETADSVVDELYEQVTFGPGELPDWDVVKSLFLKEAVIVLRTTREATTVFSVEGFVGDFVNFIETSGVGEKGFTEEIVRRKSMVFGDMAHILVLYEVSVPGSERPPQAGVDSFHLIKKEDRWWISGITNEVPTKDRPVPEELREP